MVCIPLISTLWIGRYEAAFALFGSLLSAGWFLNTLMTCLLHIYGKRGARVGPDFSGDGSGIEPSPGYCTRQQFGGVGVVCGWVSSALYRKQLWVYLAFT